MHTHNVPKNDRFVAREFERERLLKIIEANESAIVVVYGRRRVGKTELLEQTFRQRKIIKFEGIQGASEAKQRQHVLMQLSEYVEEPYIAKISVSTWSEVFKLIAKYIQKGEWTLYFEELQWLACYNDALIAELKYVWDNYYRYNEKLILILCGSSPSFMINHVIKSKSLYNRSQYEIPLNEFNLIDARKFLENRSHQEVMDAYLTVGGIPEYLRWLNKDSSVYLSLCQNAFRQGGFFTQEHERIFISSLAEKSYYKEIINVLSKKRYASRKEIRKLLKISSGGSLTNLLGDLETCGFIGKYVPYNLKSSSNIARFCIQDNYLNFYFRFIQPISESISNGEFNDAPESALNLNQYYHFLAYAFERFCRRYHRVIANIMGFSGVKYRCGAFYNRTTNQEEPGYQIDLLFERSDRVITICEIKYLQDNVKTNVISEVERKLELFPQSAGKTIEKVLITNYGADEGLKNRHYFDRIITLNDFFDDRYW